MRPLRDARAAVVPVQTRLVWLVAIRLSAAAVLIHSAPSASIHCALLACSTLLALVVAVRVASAPKVAVVVVQADAVDRWVGAVA